MMGTAFETRGRISLTISLNTTRANKTVTPENSYVSKGFRSVVGDSAREGWNR